MSRDSTLKVSNSLLSHWYYPRLLCSQYYEVYAFLRDEEVVSPLKHMLTGLSQILFDITVDTASLEFALAPEALEPALRLRAPQSVEGIVISD